MYLLECPSPSNMVRESAANQRPNNAGNTVGSTDDAGEHWPPPRGRRVRDESICARADPRSADSSDGAPDNQGLGVGRHAADQAADFEDEDGEEEGDLEGEVLVGFAPWVDNDELVLEAYEEGKD